MSPAYLEINIGELVLHGFSPHDAFRIGQAVERELARLLTERGFPSQWAAGAEIDLPQLDLGTFELPHSPAAGAVGSGLSKALHRGLRSEFSNQQPLSSNPNE